MKPSTNKSSLDAQNYVTEHGKQMKEEFASIKGNTIFSKEKKEALLDALKNSYREEHKLEKHQWVLQKKKEDTDVIRKFGEKIKWDKLTKEEFQWAKEQFYGRSESTEKKEHNYEHLLNKPGMTPEDNANMEKSIKFLVDNQKDTSENIKKLEAVKYGSNYREIAGLKFSREKVVPQVKFNDKPNKHGVFECKEKGIYKTIYNGKDEYHLTTDQYIDQTKKQWMTAIEDSHLRQALRALPWDFKDNDWYVWGNILWNILDLSMSGYVSSGGGLWDKDGCGSLSSASPVAKDSTRAFVFNEDRGGLDLYYGRNGARPCLSLIK